MIASSSVKYRPEIDGLRAIAVLPVIFFHAGFRIFAGGFVGVDVFFVISGYLITSLIVKELETGSFRFRDFYERRARRILPALFLVVITCIPFAWFWMLPDDLNGFSTSVISICLFASNILFWHQSGYFDRVAELKPLLHTWSLGVEEQFYIFFPIAVILLWRFGRRSVVWALAIIAVVSLLASEYASRVYPSFAFYMLPTRAWELLAGALCAFVNVKPDSLRDNILSGLGLAGISVAVFAFDEAIPFPSLFALVPVLGACGVVVFARAGTAAHMLLSRKIFVGVGLISYSAYLWHQPIFAFYRHLEMIEPSVGIALALCVLSFAIAVVTWKWVETPFRQRREISMKVLLSAAAPCVVLFTAFGAFGHYSGGIPQRFTNDPAKADFLAYYENTLPEWRYFARTNMSANYGDECNFYDIEQYRVGQATNIPRPSLDPQCVTRSAAKAHAVMIWGDSHAQMLRFGLLHTLPDDWQLLQVASSGCAPSLADSPKQYCTKSNRTALETVSSARPDVVILAQVNGHVAANLDAVANRLLQMGVKRVIIDGPSPQWTYDLPLLVVKRYWDTEQTRSKAARKTEVFERDATLKKSLHLNDQIIYVSLIDAFCNDEGCLMYLGRDRKKGLVSYDFGHLTPIASQFLAEHFLRDAVVSVVEKPAPPTISKASARGPDLRTSYRP